jgi:PGF-CTERM protein
MAGPYDATIVIEGSDTHLEEEVRWQGRGFDQTDPPVKNFQLVEDGRSMLLVFDSRERLSAREVVLYGRNNSSEEWTISQTRRGGQLNRAGDTYIDRFRADRYEKYVAVLERAIDSAGNDAASGQYRTVDAAPTTGDLQLTNQRPDPRTISEGQIFSVTLQTDSELYNYTAAIRFDGDVITPAEVDLRPYAQGGLVPITNGGVNGQAARDFQSGTPDVSAQRDELVFTDTTGYADGDRTELATVTFQIDDATVPWTGIEVDRSGTSAHTLSGERVLITDHGHSKVVIDPPSKEQDEGDDAGGGDDSSPNEDSNDEDGGAGGGGGGGGGAVYGPSEDTPTPQPGSTVTFSGPKTATPDVSTTTSRTTDVATSTQTPEPSTEVATPTETPRVETETNTPQTVTPGTTDTATETSTTPTSTPTSAPGFGAIVSLLALLAIGIISRRRIQ